LTVRYEMFVLRETLVKLGREGEERLRRARHEGDEPWRAKVEQTWTWEEWGVEGARLMDVTMRRRNWVRRGWAMLISGLLVFWLSIRLAHQACRYDQLAA
jgi:hypothetical protein